MAIDVPTTASSTTHCTAGLTGYPAIDFPGDLGERVYIGESGVLSNPHLIPWHQGFGGWTFTFTADNGGVYFITHLDEDEHATAGRYGAGAWIGRLTTSATDAALINGAHVHVGKTTWPSPAGQDCGSATARGPTAAKSTAGSPHTVSVPSGPAGPVGDHKTLPEAWHKMTDALGKTLPTRTKHSNTVSRNFRRAVR